MAESALIEFLADALKAGATRAEARKALEDAGWAQDQVDDALRHFAEVDFPVPVPAPRARVSARDAFLYLVMFGMLYVSAINFGSLIFRLIDWNLPDPLYPAEYTRRAIRWATASLIVAFPVFLFTATRIARNIARDPTLRASAVRKWLTYLTLFIAACVIVGDLIVLLFNLLSGELTIRIVLKALTVGGIAGGIFGYYLSSMRTDDRALGQ